MTPGKLDSIPLVKSVMTPFPWFVDITDRLSRAQEMMAQHAIRHLPVTREGRLVGVVHERDIRLLLSATSETGDQQRLRVEDIYARDVYVVGLLEPLDRVLLTMAERHLDLALVVKGGKLAGIFTVTDACRSFGEFLRRLFPPGGDEAA